MLLGWEHNFGTTFALRMKVDYSTVFHQKMVSLCDRKRVETKKRGTEMNKLKGFEVFLTLTMAAFIGGSSCAYAEDIDTNENVSKAQLSNPNSNVVPGAASVDDLITNNNLRALSGSTSRWSIASSFTYDGGTLANPFAEGRPNIAGASATSTDTDLNGQLNIKYNINLQNSILVGFGIRKMAPFVTSGPTSQFYNQGGKDMDMFDPSVTYQYIYKMGAIQSVLQVGATEYTRQDIVSSTGGNLDKNVSLDQENIYEVGKTGISLGGSIGIGGNSANDPTQDYSRYQYWFSPYLEYKISEKVNFRTVANLWTYEIYTSEGLIHDTVTQSVGFGFSVTRDIFLYPNVQFLPDHVVAGLTNVGMSATVNLF
jgi:hypothetical protein